MGTEATELRNRDNAFAEYTVYSGARISNDIDDCGHLNEQTFCYILGECGQDYACCEGCLVNALDDGSEHTVTVRQINIETATERLGREVYGDDHGTMTLADVINPAELR